MLETISRKPLDGTGSPTALAASRDQALFAGWREGLGIVNLRGTAEDAAFTTAASRALNLELPIRPCTSTSNSTHRAVWAGPDDWFLIGPKEQSSTLAAQLCRALAGTHHAATDVSSGYTVLHLSGRPVRDVLAQGCPLDLHPRVFKPDCCAGSHYFKASVWLWQTDEAPTYEILVRRSLMGYFWSMLERSSQESGLVTRRFL